MKQSELCPTLVGKMIYEIRSQWFSFRYTHILSFFCVPTNCSKCCCIDTLLSTCATKWNIKRYSCKCYYAFFLVCCGCGTSYIVSVHIQYQAFIYTLSLCCGHSWRVRLAKQETLTPPGHLVSPLLCRGPWISTVVLYCWCHSDSASVLLYFTFC